MALEGFILTAERNPTSAFGPRTWPDCAVAEGGQGGGFAPISPTTKECNSRVHSHFGRWKWRCYNRLTESIFCVSSRFSAAKTNGNAAERGKATGPAKTALKKIIS